MNCTMKTYYVFGDKESVVVVSWYSSVVKVRTSRCSFVNKNGPVSLCRPSGLTRRSCGAP